MTSTSQSSSPFSLEQCLSLIWESDYRKARAISLIKNNRVIQCSPTRFMVESRRYHTKMKPSKMYIIQTRKSGKPFDLWCNCNYAGYCPDPFNVCSHVLACYLAVCLKAGSTELLTMRDVAKKKKEQEAKQQVPQVGNEYSDHTRQKVRLHDLLIRSAWWAVQYEREVHCCNSFTGEKNKYAYSLDVFGYCEYNRGKVMAVGIEINREETGGGHGSKLTIPKDRNRAQEIWMQHEIKVISFNVSHLKASGDEQILQEIYQGLGLTW